MNRSTVVLSSVVALLILAGGEAGAQSKCTALKIKFAGKAALLNAKCEFKAALKGVPVDPECLAKAQAFLAKKWAAAEAKGDCLTTGDLGAAQVQVDACVSSVVTTLIPECGNDTKEAGEDCDGSDDALCPGVCATDCTCPNPDDLVCCANLPVEGGSFCEGGFTATECVGGGGSVGPAGTTCGSASSGDCTVTTVGDCCAFPGSCVAADELLCFASLGTYHAGTVCAPSGECVTP